MAMKKGFTLIEILVSLGLISLVGVLIAQVFFTSVRTSVKTEILQETKESGDFALDVMARMIRNAASVTTVCSSSGTTTSSLTILNPNSFTTTFGCAIVGDAARIASVSATKTEFLTSESVTLGADCPASSLSFVCTALDNGKTSVKISFSLAQKGTPVSQFEKASTAFQTTVTTRN